MAKKTAFDHRKVRGVGLHSITKGVGVRDSKGTFTGYARVIGTLGANKRQFNHAVTEVLRNCPVEREVIAFIPSSLVISRGAHGDIQLPHVKTADFQLFRETIGVPKEKMPVRFREGIEKGFVSTHLVDLPGFTGKEPGVEKAAAKRTGLKPGQPGWDFQVVDEIARRRKRILMKALKKQVSG
jgi:hypothetical protein